ncbi:MAG: aminopeptidase [Pseudomonadales bacterium]
MSRLIINTVPPNNINRCFALLLSCCLLAGCESLSFYGQAITGQLSILTKRTPIKKLLAEGQLTEAEAQRFALIEDILRFAAEEMKLPVKKTFSSYVNLQRDYVVWNVFAAPTYSVEPHEWCYPIAGCASYRGYFSEHKARAYASKLAARGFDTYIAGVKAYSTLGWFNDPILNTFMSYSDARLAGLIFHELAHKVVYIPGDTDFNESFARTVEIEGVKRWLEVRDSRQLFAAFQQRQQVHELFVNLVHALREKLQSAYHAAPNDAHRQGAKARLFAEFELEFAAFVQQYPAAKRYRFWVEQTANNAKLVPINSYNRWVPAFDALLQSDLETFFDLCRDLAEQKQEKRDSFLSARIPP